jgi:DNA-binding NarL/FixJ family response regulator
MEAAMASSVYIVDDAANVRERLQELIDSIGGLRTAGFAARADTAIDGIVASRPDVAIVDVSLAHGTGFDVLRAVRESAPGTKVCMLSNSAGAAYRERAVELGAAEFFDKTLELAALRAFLVRCR